MAAADDSKWGTFIAVVLGGVVFSAAISMFRDRPNEPTAEERRQDEKEGNERVVRYYVDHAKWATTDNLRRIYGIDNVSDLKLHVVEAQAPQWGKYATEPGLSRPLINPGLVELEGTATIDGKAAAVKSIETNLGRDLVIHVNDEVVWADGQVVSENRR